MKTLRLFSAALMLLSAAAIGGCTDYDDDYNALSNRVGALEDLVKDANNQLAAMKTLAQALEAGDYIKAVSPVTDGYRITFEKFGEITINNGKDGQDAVAPEISLKNADPDGDGVSSLYWALDGELLKYNGEPVKADAKDALQPRLEVVDGRWVVYYGDSTTGTDMGPAIGAQGEPGQNAEPLFFEKVELMTNAVKFTLAEKDPVTGLNQSFTVPVAVYGVEKLFCKPSKLDEDCPEYRGAMYPGQTVMISKLDVLFGAKEEVKVKVTSDPAREYSYTMMADTALLVTYNGRQRRYDKKDYSVPSQMILLHDSLMVELSNGTAKKTITIVEPYCIINYKGKYYDPLVVDNRGNNLEEFANLSASMTIPNYKGIAHPLTTDYVTSLPLHAWPKITAELEVLEPAASGLQSQWGELNVEKSKIVNNYFKLCDNYMLRFSDLHLIMNELGGGRHLVLRINYEFNNVTSCKRSVELSY